MFSVSEPVLGAMLATGTIPALRVCVLGIVAALAGHGRVLVEFGSGSSRKTSLLLAALAQVPAYIPIDIAAESLEEAAAWDGLAARLDVTAQAHVVIDTGMGRWGLSELVTPGSGVVGLMSHLATADSTESGPDTDTLDIPVAQSPALNVVKSSSTTSVTAAMPAGKRSARPPGRACGRTCA